MQKQLPFISLLSFFLAYNLQLSLAQDTIVVQTFTYDSTSRSATFAFPELDGTSYSKVLLEYSMRCHDAIAGGSGNVGCYEWDYTCNTVITDPSRTDSTRATHPSHTISNFSGDEFEYVSSPTYTSYQYTQKEVTVSDNSNSNFKQMGMGNAPLSAPFGTTALSGKTQFIWRADELAAAGIEQGSISGIKLWTQAMGSEVRFLKVKMQHTSLTQLNPNEPILDGFQEVYFRDVQLQDIGEQQLNFYAPFTYNGTDNLLLEFDFSNLQTSADNLLESEQTLFIAGIQSQHTDYALTFNGAQQLSLGNTGFSQVVDEISISFWSNGSTTGLPSNSTVFEGTDASNRRQVNVHLPWGNERIYWDCGNDGSGYDRIEKAANLADYAGQWNHWAFTKNATKGSMKIYLNGELWHEGSDKFRKIDLQALDLGGSLTGGSIYHGMVDEFQVWSKELDGETIRNWMHQQLDSSHPAYDHLVSYYQFNETEGNTMQDASSNRAQATMQGPVLRHRFKGEELFTNFKAILQRPNIAFETGLVSLESADISVVEEVQNPSHQVISYAVTPANDIIGVDTILTWQAGHTYLIHVADGNIIDSTYHAPENAITPTNLTYYIEDDAMRFELLSFITPYGNGLDLGPNGKMWTFEVTDFLPILNGEKKLSIEGRGNYQEEMDLRFLFIKGTPTREVIDIQQVWPITPASQIWSGRSFQGIVDDRTFEPREVPLLADEGSMYKVRVAMTGHGQNGEFVPQTHYIDLNNNTQRFEWLGLKKCGNIPVYPQGGTWLFDRAGWCPGDPTDVQEFELSPHVQAGETITLDYGIYEDPAYMDAADFRTSVQLVTYGPPNFTNDIEIVEVKRPSNRVEYARINPACNNPIITVRNNGTEEVKFLEIRYGIKGDTEGFDFWAGDLKFLETAEIELPTSDYQFWNTDIENPVFWVQVIDPKDQNPQNDRYESPFTLADQYNENVYINLRTNNRPEENSYQLRNHSGNVIFERKNMDAATRYNDEIEITQGCYSIYLQDTGEDGLDFWYWGQIGINVGTGNFELRRENGSPIKQFNPDFGSSISYDFAVYPDSVGTALEDDLGYRIFSTYPNPSDGIFQVELQGFTTKQLSLEVYDLLGKQIYQKSLTPQLSHQENINLSQYPTGIYILKLNDGKRIWKKQLIINN